MLHIKLEEKIKIIINMKDSLEQSCSRLFLIKKTRLGHKVSG